MKKITQEGFEILWFLNMKKSALPLLKKSLVKFI